MKNINLSKQRMTRKGAYGSNWLGFQINLLHGLKDLCEKFITKNMSVLELGTNIGVSTELFCQYSDLVTTIDIRNNNSILELKKQYQNLTFIESSSEKYLNHCINNNIKYDLIYIDAQHDFDPVLKDITLSKKVVRPNGVISGHDMLDKNANGVLKAVGKSFPEILSGSQILHRFSDSSWAIQLGKE